MRIKKINHVTLHVKDVAASCRFYGEVLGLRQLPRPDFDIPGAWFSLGNQQLHLIGGRAAPVQSSNRGNHFCVDVEGFDAYVGRLRDHDVQMVGPKLRPDGGRVVFAPDPDGHVIELFDARKPDAVASRTRGG